MFTTFIQHVPYWVWLLLAGLIALGISQSFPRRRTLYRATIMPILLTLLSFYGVVSAFPFQAIAIASWAGGLAFALMLSSAISAWSEIRWSAAEQRLIVPGSWIPMMLILGLFMVKFSVGVTLALHPDLRTNSLYAALVSLAYGGFSGGFLGRGVAMWKVAHLTRRELSAD